MKATLRRISYGGWAHCLSLGDGRTEVVVTTDVGPRVMRFAIRGGRNVLYENPDQLGATGGARWRIYGGHRLWIAPEDRRRTYVADNDPVAWTWDGRTLRLVQKPERASRLQKELHLRYVGDGTLRLAHRITNKASRAIELAPWALSVMRSGGRAVFPNEPYGSPADHILPARPLVLWPYTDMGDPRWTWGRRLVVMSQDTRRARPQKVGFRSTPCWMAYVLADSVFFKRHTLRDKAVYPDFGCNAECFANHEIVELETLGPLTRLGPGGMVEHVETWGLWRGRVRASGDAALARKLLALLDRVAPP